MKNFLKIGLVAAIFFTANNVQANDGNFSVHVKGEKEKTIRFFINEAKDANLTICESDDKVIYQEKIHALQPSTKIYDLNAFPEGNYVLKVESGSKLAEYKIVIENGQASVSAPTIKELFKPVITKEDKVVTLNLDNATKGPVQVQILNEYNDELFSKVYKDQAQLTKKFNTSKTYWKELTFVVKSKDQEFTKTIETR